MTDFDEMLSRIRGLYFGQLDEAEKEAFEELRREGFVALSYEGAGGMMGMGKVRVIKRSEFFKVPTPSARPSS